MARIKCRLKSSAENASIFLQLSLGRGKVYERKTGLRVSPKNWSRETGYPKQTLAQYKKLTSDLRKLESAIYEGLNEAEVHREIIDGKWLQDEIDIFFGRKSRSGHEDSVLYWIEEVMKSAELRKNSKGGRGLSKSRVGQYRRLKNLFEEFQGRKRHRIKDIDRKLGKEFFRFLFEEKNYGEAYSLKMMANLKSVCYEAESYGIDSSPQLRTIDSGKPKPGNIVYLTPDELNKIARVNIDSSHLKNARKWLLLGCWVGQRAGDLVRIDKDSIKEESGIRFIELTQQKTGKTVQIPILPQVHEIIVSGIPNRISPQNLNVYFKEVCRLAGIDELISGKKNDPVSNRKVDGVFPKYDLISTHVCRRSFCTNLYGELPTPVIMQASGHSTEKTFLAYIGRSGMDYRDHWKKYIASIS